MNSDLAVSGSSAIGADLAWLQAVFAGPVATSVAIIAVGWFGMMLMAGRVSRRGGVRVILGCFIIFGASTIAGGIMRGFVGSGSAESVAAIPTPAPVPPVLVESTRVAQPYDPYAGAALPPRR